MKNFALLSVIISILLITSCSPSTPDTPYRVLSNTQVSQHPQVIEFFAYFCPHCNHLEATLEPWKNKLPSSVKLIRLPLTLGNAGTRIYSRAYFIGESLHLLEKSHQALFDRYHKQKLTFQNEQQLKAFFISLGVSEADYDIIANDPKIEQKIDDAETLAKSMGIASVPSFVVNNRYMTDAGISGGEKELFSEINILLRKKETTH